CAEIQVPAPSGFPIRRRGGFIDSSRLFPQGPACSLKRLGMPRYEPWNADRAGEIIARYRHVEGATLPILQALQDTFGCVPEAAARSWPRRLICHAPSFTARSPSITTSRKSRSG